MISIRKFVGYTGAAAGMGAALALTMSAQSGLAAAPSSPAGDQATVEQINVSPACAAALQAIRSAVITDMSEDRAERVLAESEPELAPDQTDDATEASALQALFATARSACAPSVSTAAAPTATSFAPSAQCTAAIQAAKAAWTQGRPSTIAQWKQLQALAQAVRTACGWTWTGER